MRGREKKEIFMKIVFNRQQVLNATSPLMCATSGKSTLSAIEGILIEAKHPDICTMTTYDLEKGVRVTMEAQVLEEGRFIVNAQKFVQTLRVMEGETVTLSVSPQLIAVMEGGKFSHKMSALKGEDFPDLPMLESERGFTVPEGTLRRMMAKTMHAMATDDQRRPILNGCYFDVKGNQLMLVACDSFRLAKCILRTEIDNNNKDGSDLNFHFIVPIKTMNELFRLIGNGEEEKIRIHMMRKHIIFYVGDIIFFSRLLEGDYIDFDRIIIRQHKIHVKLDRDELLGALERASLITEERVSGRSQSHVKLELESGVLKVLAASAAGSTYDEMEVEHEGGDILIAFNNKYLIESVRACDANRVRISLSSPLTSINIEPDDGKEEGTEDLFMLLPVKMKD